MKWDSEGAPKKPAIIGIGAQKAGTTWLSQMLGQHPSVWSSPFKEVQFFNYLYNEEHRNWLPWHFRASKISIAKRYAARGQEVPAEVQLYLDRITRGKMFTKQWYKQVFAPAPEGLLPMDVTPEYSTLSAEGVDFATGFLPQAKFIYIIRHPVDRAISQLKMNLTRAKRKPATLDDWMEEIEDPVLLDRGNYAEFVPRWNAKLDKERLLYLPFGAISRTPTDVMRRVEAFLGLAPHEYKNLADKVFPANAALSVPDPARAALRAKLEEQFDFIETTFGAEFSDLIR